MGEWKNSPGIVGSWLETISFRPTSSSIPHNKERKEGEHFIYGTLLRLFIFSNEIPGRLLLRSQNQIGFSFPRNGSRRIKKSDGERKSEEQNKL